VTSERTPEELAELLVLLAPAPREWVIAAKELPPARVLIDGVVARAEADAEYRARAIADIEAALREAGADPVAPLLAEVRRRLGP
jgi:hypothetical protein